MKLYLHCEEHGWGSMQAPRNVRSRGAADVFAAPDIDTAGSSALTQISRALTPAEHQSAKTTTGARQFFRGEDLCSRQFRLSIVIGLSHGRSMG